MTEISFYHLTTSSLDRALPRLMAKAYEGGFRVLVKAADEVMMDKLNTALWTFDPNSFLPHGSRKDAHREDQPIYITDTAEDAPNTPTLLVVADGSAPENLADYARVLDMFDGADEKAVAAARTRWKSYKDAGHSLKYLQQTKQGGWEQKAAA